MILKINDRIRNRRLDFFDKFALSLRYDSIASSFKFAGYFNPDNNEQKEMYCVGHFHTCTVEHNNELLLTGTILNEGFGRGRVRELAVFDGYSLPGVLENCNIPPDIYPLQSDGLTLKEIASKLIKPFGLTMIIDGSVSAQMDEPYTKTTAEATETIKDYLTKLATQKDVIITNDARGRIVFTKAKTRGTPILDFNVPKGGAIPGTKIGMTFNGHDMHSHIHVMKQADINGGNAGETVIRNPYVPFVYRPRVIIQNSGDDNDTEKLAKRALAAELKNLKLTITTDRWEMDGKIIKPNNLITVTCPDVYLYKKSTWFIEEISFEGDAESTTAVLTCCLPEVYNGQTPRYLFEGINLH